MRRILALVLLAIMLCGCGTQQPPEPTENPGVTALPEPVFSAETGPETTEPLHRESITDLIHLMDYAILLEALLDAGCQELCWAIPDLDGDGLPELTAQTFAGNSAFPSQIIADGSTLCMEGFTATGTSQNAGFCTNEAGITGLFSGYNALGITDGHFYRWTGSHLQELTEPGEATGDVGRTSIPELQNYESLSFANPELRVLISPLEAQVTANIFHAAYLNRGLDMQYLAADLDGDGLEEYLFLLGGAADDFLAHVTGMSFGGDEKFLGCSDRQTSAVVVSSFAGRTWVRLARMEADSAEAFTQTENGLTANGHAYLYQSSGIPFLPSDAARDQTIETELVRLTLPDSWRNRYSYSYYERSDEDGSRSLIALVFREQTGYLSFGGGHLFSLILLPDGASIDYPEYEQLGTLTHADGCYTVLAVFPSDVQHTEENQASYIAMREDIPAILATLTPAEGAVFTPQT